MPINTPKAPGWFWLLSGSGKPPVRPHYCEIVRVYHDAQGRLVYSRIGRVIERVVTLFPDGAPGWRWGSQVPDPIPTST